MRLANYVHLHGLSRLDYFLRAGLLVVVYKGTRAFVYPK